MKRFSKSTWVLIGVAFCGLLLAATVGPFIGRFILQLDAQLREDFRYTSDMSMLGHQLEEYLQHYYMKHSRYPDRLNISQFEAWKEPKYRTILDRITYSTDGNSFEIVWKRPIHFRSEDDWFVWTCKGQGGKRTHFETETVRTRSGR